MEQSSSHLDQDVLNFLEYSSGTDVGMKRDENQDSFGVLQAHDFHFYIVADGMGGVKGGAIASKLSIEVFSGQFEEGQEVSSQRISEAVQLANRSVFSAGVEDPTLAGMGTTFVGLAFCKTGLFVFNVGDSRAFRIREGKLEQLTEDHTLINELVRSGALTEDQAENHPVSHMLTRSLGPTESIQPDCWLRRDGPAAGDRYILCSDGLYNHVPNEELAGLVAGLDAETAQESLIKLANERGGSDNITVIVVDVSSEYSRAASEFQEEAVSTVELYIGAPSDAYVNGSSAEVDVEADTEALESPRLESGVEFSDIHIELDNPIEEEQEGAEEQETQASAAVQKPANGLPVVLLLMLAGFLSVTLVYLLSPNFEAPQAPLQQASQNRPASPEQVVESKELEEQFERDRRIDKPDEKVAASPKSSSVSDVVEDSKAPALVEESYSEIEARRKVIIVRAGRIEEQISSFDKPLSGAVAQVLQNNSSEIEALQDELEKTRAAIDVATRRLAVWFGRRKRLLRMAPVNLAAEVSASSELVREKKAEFDKVTWELLKADEERRYNPNDPDLNKKAQELSDERRKMNAELGRAIENAIETALAESDQRITELTLRRDELESRLRFAEREYDYARILTKGTPDEKRVKKQKLIEELESLKSELEHLEQVREAQQPDYLSAAAS